VVITGGSRGLGLLLARHASGQGAIVALLARNEEELARAESELLAKGRGVIALVCDVTRQVDVDTAMQTVLRRFGRIDVLINNAGIIQIGPLEHMTEADFEQTMRVHFWGPLHCINAVLPHMRSRRAGRIANITSIGGEVAVPHLAPYAASKFALVGLSNAVRAEVAKDGIRVTTVVPGLMRTGSPLNALVKGRHQAEYAWFATLSSLPLMTANADRAAKKILDACRHGDAYLTITPQARLATMFDALAPNVSAWLAARANQLLPPPDGRWGDQAWTGRDSRPRQLPRLATMLSDRAAVRNNEI
jgi:NAD(P)-dependent dehydrogenase (short-subunit alcohol dehydrogenase family)